MYRAVKREKEIGLVRRYLAVAALVYLVWWFAVEALLPGAFNPLGSRLGVVTLIASIWVASFFIKFVRDRLEWLLYASVWLITAHYFYLFYGNQGDINWIVGSFITVIAVTFCFGSVASLFAYSAFTLLLSLILVVELPALANSVFLPGLLTMLVQANLGLRSQLRMIRVLEESNTRFQQLFNSTFEGVLVHENGRIVAANEALSHLAGYTRDELVGRKILDILAPEDRAIAEEKMRLAVVEPFEAKGLNKDGHKVDVEIRAREFEHGGKTSRLVTVLDLTDRKRVEREKFETAAMAENVRLRDEFISMASHELKTPLTSLSLQTQMIERDLRRNGGAGYTPTRLGEMAALYSRQIKRLTELVETMLDVSRISIGKLSLATRGGDLAALAREVLNHPQYARCSISAEIEASVPVEVDPARIEQVLTNLLNNAVKYGNEKPILVRVFSDRGEGCFEIEDQGLGIAEEFLPKIFDRFERAVSPRSIAGLGLGLYISRQIIEAHGGKIHVRSQLGKGSTFTVRLPGPRLLV